MERVFSGIQPTHGIHLGNYLGAIRHWVRLQNEGRYACIYCIVDQHALTTVHDRRAMTDNTYEVAAALLACGIDPAKSILFVQSNVPAHAQLHWVLGCVTPLGWLNRMTQFKEKAGKDREGAPLGLYAYPVLQAADILAYKATLVPVGEDQKQHLELSRDIAGAFNRKFGVDFFPLPEPLITGEATRVMSLRDGRKKMSKSDPSDMSRINLTDDPDQIALKIRRARSDSIRGIWHDPENRPEASNLLRIYAALSERPIEELEREFRETLFSEFKQKLTELLIEKIAPITARMREYLADRPFLDRVLAEGAERAHAIAAPILEEVYDIVGFVRPGRRG